MASICEFCGKRVNEALKEYDDGFGEKFNICNKCYSRVSNGDCYKCGKKGIQMDGKCASCCQIDAYKQNKKSYEAAADLGNLDLNSNLTEEQFENWLTNYPIFDFHDMETDPILRKIWIMTKLRGVGIVDESIINEHYADIEKLIDMNLNKLKNTRCRMIIAYTPQLRKLIRKYSGSGIIAMQNDVYLFNVDTLCDCDDDDYKDDNE